MNQLGEASLWLDGNAIAGLLDEVFATEMTLAMRRCHSCGTHSPIGAHRAYRGAGVVLRCPACGEEAMRISMLANRYIVLMTGQWTLEVPRG